VLFGIFFSTKHGITFEFMFLVIQRSINFYSEFYVHLLCDFFVVLDYDEINCNLFLEFFLMYYEVQILVI